MVQWVVTFSTLPNVSVTFPSPPGSVSADLVAMGKKKKQIHIYYTSHKVAGLQLATYSSLKVIFYTVTYDCTFPQIYCTQYVYRVKTLP